MVTGDDISVVFAPKYLSLGLWGLKARNLVSSPWILHIMLTSRGR